MFLILVSLVLENVLLGYACLLDHPLDLWIEKVLIVVVVTIHISISSERIGLE